MNLVDRQIEVYSDPAGPGYQRSEVFGADGHVPLIVAGQEVGRLAVSDVLP